MWSVTASPVVVCAGNGSQLGLTARLPTRSVRPPRLELRRLLPYSIIVFAAPVVPEVPLPATITYGSTGARMDDQRSIIG